MARATRGNLLVSGATDRSAAAGETWRFKSWYRDIAGGAATSNVSDAVPVTLR